MKKVLFVFFAIAIVITSSVYAVAKEAYKLGDVDQNGSVSIKDATKIQFYLAGFEEENASFKKLADVNGDGKVNILDVTTIQQYLAEIIDKLPGENVTTPTHSTDSGGYYDQIVKP